MMKMHYPPKAEDAVSLVDLIFDKAVEATRTVKQLATGLATCAEQMKSIAYTMAVIAHNQAVHHQMILQMWGVQQAIFRKLHDNSMDMKMPDLDGQVKVDPKDDAAIAKVEAKKKATSKPN